MEIEKDQVQTKTRTEETGTTLWNLVILLFIDPKSRSCHYNDTRNNNENDKANIEVKRNVFNIKRMITAFIRGNVFPGLKFVSTNFLVPLLISTELENPNFSFRKGIEDKEFEFFYKGKVSTEFTELRHALQQHSKRTYIGK